MDKDDPRGAGAQDAEPHDRHRAIRAAVGSAAGTTIENYDFVAYALAAALYFGQVFFNPGDPGRGVLLSFATLGVGFAARPIGGLLAGYAADKIGRRPVLIASLLAMGICTILIGCLPTHAQVGIASAYLLVGLRILQGVAFGGEWGGAILMAFEHAPRRMRGIYTAIPQVGVPLGNLLANAAFFASVFLPGNWAWRAPFLFSVTLVAAGLYIRLRVTESPDFVVTARQGRIQENPLRSAFRSHWRDIVRAFGLRLAETGGYAVAIVFIPSYLHVQHLASRREVVTGLLIGAAAATLTNFGWGRLTDLVGRRPIYLVGCSLMIVFAVPLFLLINTGRQSFIILAFVTTFALCETCLAAVQGSWFAELFDTAVRASSVSIAYQASALVAGFTAFFAVWVFDGFGWPGVAALYMAFGAIGLVSAIATRETSGPSARAERASQPRAAFEPEEPADELGRSL